MADVELATTELTVADRSTTCQSTTLQLVEHEAPTEQCDAAIVWIVSCRHCASTTYLCDRHADAAGAVYPLMCMRCKHSGRGFGLLRFTMIGGE